MAVSARARPRSGSPAPAGRVGGELEHADVIQAGRAGGFGHPVPQLEHLLEHPQRAVRTPGPSPRRPPPADAAASARSSSCAPRQCSAASDHEGAFGPGPRTGLQPSLQRRRVGGVQPHPASGKQVLVHRLAAQQGVPERIAVGLDR